MLRRINLLVLLCLLCSNIKAALPQTEGERQRYNVQIDVRGGYISGICAMLMEDGIIKASIINEFGVSAMDFTYSPEKDKVKLINVIDQMDHWYIRRVLKRDLREVMHQLKTGNATYEDTRYKIKYTFEESEN